MPEVLISVGGMFRTIDQSTDVATRQALLLGSGDILQEIVDECPKDSGDLAKSIYIEEPQLYGKNRYRIIVRVTDDQVAKFRYVVRGSRGANIAPTSKKALAFDWTKSDPPRTSKDGRVIFRRVTVPPRKANNFPRRAIRRAARRITGLMASAFVVSISK